MQRTLLLAVAVAMLVSVALAYRTEGPKPEVITVAPEGRGFLRGQQPFVPWGFNYDHDAGGELLETYWHEEWDAVVEDFQEMKALGATTVRIHLQFGAFFPEPGRPNERNVARLRRLVGLAEQTGLALDITGLGCYLKEQVPEWYDRLDEPERWAAQAEFWKLIADVCKDSPAIFCYDLMNEPVVPGKKRRGGWLARPFAGRYHFVQFISLGVGDRPREQVALAWIRTLKQAIREIDRDHLITVGLVPWSLRRPGLTSGFDPMVIGAELDFLAVHIYPRKHRVADAVDTIQAFARIKRPLLIEETFPLHCGVEELVEVIDRTEPFTDGWVSFYWGKLPEELRKEKSISAAITAAWLEAFVPRMKRFVASRLQVDK